MSAQPRQASISEVWTRWEGQLVKGTYPLRRVLGGSDQGAVFLSEYGSGKTSNVAIKIVPAVGAQAEMRLAHWRTAAALTHPNLVRLFDMGRCQLGGREYLFVVMEHGEQTLAEFLAQRALTAEEARPFLRPTLDALAFLHGNQMVHAQLKPSNFLVVNDQLKLASDTVRPLGHRGLAAADDVFSLGMTLLEALTQRIPISPNDQDEVGSLLANVPATFATTVRRCLHPNPASRPTVVELQTQHESARQSDASSEDGPRPHHPLLLAIPALMLFGLAVWIANHPSGGNYGMVSQPTVAPAPTPARTTPAVPKSVKPAPPPVSRPQPASQILESLPPPVAMPTSGSPDVVREVIPDITRAEAMRIQDSIFVKVRVLVDSTGSVMAVLMEKAGPNRRFANLADEAARQWKFVPAENEGTRVWILTFEFTPYGVTARATDV